MTAYLTLPWRVAAFALWFAGEVVTSSYAVLSDAVTPGFRFEPRVVRMPLDSRSDAQVTLIASLITLTPGTLTLGVVPGTDGARELLVHSMYHHDTGEALHDLRDMERRMLRALTVKGAP
ncbi:Na+/H+ antiporter subunit E [Streptomyces otsuchiensis]|uniref:Na+/H+ antiporter subunit E n=1 Tax=Streptomyces otsuchiensis TaxID=2681388 RepID=UPI0010325349|nr:Na+/H+ antiporter subunit E [Streptomyces otsuchiensis]